MLHLPKSINRLIGQAMHEYRMLDDGDHVLIAVSGGVDSLALAATLQDEGWRLVSGGTDNHLLLVDVFSKGITGKVAEKALDQAGITAFDPVPAAGSPLPETRTRRPDRTGIGIGIGYGARAAGVGFRNRFQDPPPPAWSPLPETRPRSPNRTGIGARVGGGGERVGRVGELTAKS